MMESRHLGPGLFIVAAACSYYVAIAPFLLGHTDLGWHLAAGDLIRQQGGVPVHDPWSFTAGDKRWFNLSWLWDVAASLLAPSGHFTALVLATIGLGGVIVGALAAIAFGCGATPGATAVAVIAACLLYPTFAAPDIFLAASPNIATLLFCVTFYGVCLRGRQLWLAPVAMVAWVNMHGGFVLGLFIVGVFAGVALLRRDWRMLRTFCVVGVACAAATLVNPLGWQVYVGVLSTLGHFVQRYITEWQPYWGNITWPQSLPALAYMGLFAALELTGRRGVPAAARLLSWCFLLLGLLQLRYLSIFFLFSAVPVALHLSARFAGLTRVRLRETHLTAAGIAIAVLLPVMYGRAVPAEPGFPPIYPETEITYLAAHFPQARLLNHWNYGGILIYRLRGTIKVFVDGRAATAYPDAVLHDYFDLITWEVDEAVWRRVLQQYRIDTILWPKVHTQLAAFLAQEGWRQAYAGPIAAIYVKEPAP